MSKSMKGWMLCVLGAWSALFAMIPVPAVAHGERATEPYIRTRSVHWYDVTWSTDKVGVNETVTVAGKFRLFNDWPDAASKPDLVFLSNVTPGAVMTRVESYVDDIPAQQSMRNMQLGRDYSFKLVMKGRIPGDWHLHPVLNVHGAGPIVGPGVWVTVTGNAADFKAPVKTLTGNQIDDLQTFGVAKVQMWQAGYALLALAWLVWWLRRPLIIPRLIATQAGRDDLLITRTDDRVAAGTVVLVLLIVITGYNQTTAAYPYLVPLQSGFTKAIQKPAPAEPVSIALKDARYDVPGRSLRMKVEITNNSSQPVRVGEFMTANLRFINKNLDAAVAGIDPSFPKDLIPGSGLKIGDDSPIAPGETKAVALEATDAAWEVERLVSFLSNVDSKMGGLVFFFDEKGNRYISEVSGPIIPVFTHLQANM